MRDVIIESHDLDWLTVNQLKHLMTLETFYRKTKKTRPLTALSKYRVHVLYSVFVMLYYP